MCPRRLLRKRLATRRFPVLPPITQARRLFPTLRPRLQFLSQRLRLQSPATPRLNPLDEVLEDVLLDAEELYRAAFPPPHALLAIVLLRQPLPICVPLEHPTTATSAIFDSAVWSIGTFSQWD